MNLRQIAAAIAITGIAFTSCNSAANREREAAYQAQQQELESLKNEMARQRIIDSMSAVAKIEADEKKTTTSTSSSRRSSPRSSYAGEERVYVHTASQPATQTVYQQAPAAEPEKKGWSAKAKGALIGAGVGAAGGAVIHKRDRAKGAVVGGILGAGAGLGTGAIIDKKNGR